MEGWMEGGKDGGRMEEWRDGSHPGPQKMNGYKPQP